MSSIAPQIPPIDDPDGDLVRQIAAGDSQAASQLVTRHLSSMINVAYYMLGDRIEAEDIAQEVFLKVWLHAKNWQPGKAKFSTWMHKVALNLCYDRLRKKREVYMEVLPDNIDETLLSADELLARSQTKRQIKSAIYNLPPRQRAAITLCHLREMRNIEAAKVMQISIDALESLLARGRRALRISLATQVDEMLDN